MTLKIYNTLSAKKEPFAPLDPEGKRVTIYNCGPTVYDRFHIGNARNFVVMDVARRYLEWLGFEVTLVQNLTDIDDKIIARAAREGRSAEAVGEEFSAAYFEDADKLGVRRATEHPKATEYVAAMIEFIEGLVVKGLAYEAGGSVYFRVRAFEGYGKLSGRNIDDLREGARVEVNREKEDPLDFVLWKAAKPGEPKWACPWGEGRPGWHTECAVMTRALLGETIDIHSGGNDLMFPHHENEIAQREGLSGKPMARFWMHNGFLNIDNEKMSKSIGNVLRIDQVLARHRKGAVRLFLLSAHYRHPLDYNEAALIEAGHSLERIEDGLATGRKILALEGVDPAGARADRGEERLARFVAAFEEAMNDDFNTPRAMAALHEIVGEIHTVRRGRPVEADYLKGLVLLGAELAEFFGLFEDPEESQGGEVSGAVLAVARDAFGEAKSQGAEGAAAVFAQGLSAEQVTALADPNAPLDWSAFGGVGRRGELIELLIEVRAAARVDKAYALADRVRSGLAEAGIALEDHPQGTIWKEPTPAGPKP